MEKKFITDKFEMQQNNIYSDKKCNRIIQA